MRKMYGLIGLLPIVALAFMDCIGHGSCYRNIEGVVKTAVLTKGLSARICQDFGHGFGYDSNCDSKAVDSSGKYKLIHCLMAPQDDCSNDCKSKYNNTLPVQMNGTNI